MVYFIRSLLKFTLPFDSLDPQKLRFKDPIFPNKPQFTFPQDVSTCSYDLVDFLCSEIPIFNLGRIRSSAFPRARNQITEINITCQHLSKSVLILVQSSFHMVGFSVLICFAKLPACSRKRESVGARRSREIIVPGQAVPHTIWLKTPAVRRRNRRHKSGAE